MVSTLSPSPCPCLLSPHHKTNANNNNTWYSCWELTSQCWPKSQNREAIPWAWRNLTSSKWALSCSVTELLHLPTKKKTKITHNLIAQNIVTQNTLIALRMLLIPKIPFQSTYVVFLLHYSNVNVNVTLRGGICISFVEKRKISSPLLTPRNLIFMLWGQNDRLQMVGRSFLGT